jgi:hypothetical protein
MKPIDNPAVENLRQRTAQMLTAIDDTPIRHMDATFHQHYCEELRLLAQEWLTATTSHCPTLPDQTWVITRDGLLVGLCTTSTATALTAGIPDLTFTPPCPLALGHRRPARTLDGRAAPTRYLNGAVMRGISREVLARDAAWTLDDGNCKDLTKRWAAWENAYLATQAITDRARVRGPRHDRSLQRHRLPGSRPGGLRGARRGGR